MVKKTPNLMSPSTTKALFEDSEIRREWHKDEWWFAIIDVVAILAGSKDPKGYIKDMRRRDNILSEGWGQFATPLAIKTKGGKQKVNCANTAGILRLIQSIPSPKSEPFKQWLASLGNQKIEEHNDPELGMQRARDRAIQSYREKGMNDNEIALRLQTIDIRHDYTDELKTRGIEGREYGLLTNVSYQGRAGKNTKEYMKHKGLVKGDNLRDHMNRTEMLLTGLSEEAGKEIMKSKDAQGFMQVQKAVSLGSDVAKKAKEDLEEKLGSSILDTNNRLTDRQKKGREKRKKKLDSKKNKPLDIDT